MSELRREGGQREVGFSEDRRHQICFTVFGSDHYDAGSSGCGFMELLGTAWEGGRAGRKRWE